MFLTTQNLKMYVNIVITILEIFQVEIILEKVIHLKHDISIGIKKGSINQGNDDPIERNDAGPQMDSLVRGTRLDSMEI